MILEHFPMVSQLSEITSDGKPSDNAQFDCVAASIGACILWYQGKQQWDERVNPDRLKDAVYGESYQGGTAAQAYTAICQKLGFTLTSYNGNPGAMVIEAHKQLREGHPVIFTEPDPYVSASLGWTHVCVFYGETANGLIALDPYIAKPISRTDAEWTSILQFNQIWILLRKEEDVILDISMPVIATHFSQIDADHWRCKATGKIIQFGILDWYRSNGAKPYGGFSILGLPKSNEQPLQGGKAVRQFYERGVAVYDPDNLYGKPEGSGDVYLLQLYDGGPGTDPAIADLEAQIATPALVASLQTKIANAQKALA